MPTRTQLAITLLGISATLVAVPAAPTPAAAQQGESRVLVSTRAACRAGPTSAANVVVLFSPKGDRGGLGQEIVPVQSVTSAAGEVWFRVSPGAVKWTGVEVGCWLSESVLVPSRGRAADLLNIADHLLAAPEGLQLTEWVAAHNLFLHRWHRETVDASAILSLRRLELLDRAMSVVVEPGRWPPTLAELDPLVHAWVESLGDQVAYSSDTRRWRVSREAFQALHEEHRDHPLADEILQSTRQAPSVHESDGPAAAESASSGAARQLAIIALDATCGRDPSLASEVWWTLPLDHHFSSDRADSVVDRERWTFVPSIGCWVQASLTAPGNTDEHVIRITERFFTAPEGRTPENFMRLYNFLTGRRHGHPDAVERSPILGLRRLEVLEEVFATAGWSVDPLTLAVIETLDSDLRYIEYAGGWSLRDDAVVNLYERYRGQPEAHEILWHIASASALHDCEGDLACFIEAEILNRVARYWVDYPEGPHMTDAVVRAVDRLGSRLQGCRTARDAEQGSQEAEWLAVVDWDERGAEAVRQLRSTLSEVGEATKAPLLRLLDDLERCATELGVRHRPTSSASVTTRPRPAHRPSVAASVSSPSPHVASRTAVTE